MIILPICGELERRTPVMASEPPDTAKPEARPLLQVYYYWVHKYTLSYGLFQLGFLFATKQLD